MIRMRQAQMALATLVALSGYLRPKELIRLRKCDAIPPVAGVSVCWTLLLCPEEEMEPSKTGVFDDSLTLDSPYLQNWFPAAMSQLADSRSTERLWSFAWPSYLKVFKECRRQLGLPKLVPYMLRHSGVSIDRANHYRDAAPVQKRGRWMSHKSVARYEKAARLAKTARSYSAELQAFLDTYAPRLEEVSLGICRSTDEMRPPYL